MASSMLALVRVGVQGWGEAHSYPYPDLAARILIEQQVREQAVPGSGSARGGEPYTPLVAVEVAVGIGRPIPP
eukprot:scaffold66518_cov52-Phaeocystis_antarctica.AAC.6